MFRWLRRRRGPRQHPTPQQAYDALAVGGCLYSPISKCSGPPRITGLAHEWDENDVLVCKAHYGRLRKIDERTLRNLERHLRKAFARPTPPWKEKEDDRVVLTRGISSR
jgi:hypothetical protein